MENKQILGRIGMFDQIKGMGMILVLCAHSFSTGFVSFPSNLMVTVCTIILLTIGASLMPVFFSISGYGFRKSGVRKCVVKQCRMILKPYVFTAIAVTILNFVSRYIWVFHSIKESLMSACQVGAGFLLALPDAVQINGISIFNCGPMYYIVSLFIGWIILNAIMQYLPEKWWTVAVCIITLIGWIIGLKGIIVFCIPQGFISVLFLYMGFKGKREGFFKSNWLMEHWYIAALMWLVAIIKVLILGVDSMASGTWTAGPFGIFLDGIVGLTFVYFLLRINWNNSKIGELLGKIGANSLYIFATHTVEFHGIPWYLFLEKYGDAHPYLTCVIVLILRSILIFIMVNAVKQINRIWKVLKSVKLMKEKTI